MPHVVRLLAPWTRLSAIGAPLALLAGCVFGALAQPHFDSRVGTISALAALGAHERWRMTTALVVLGLCHVATALGLRAVHTLGRTTLAVGGVATVLVAAFPLPAVGNSTAHFVVACIAFFTLAAWPAVALAHGSRALRPMPNALAAISLFALLGWFALALYRETGIGVAERACAFAEAIWPMVVVLSYGKPKLR